MKTKIIVMLIGLLTYVAHAQTYTGLFYATDGQGMHTDQWFNLVANSGATVNNNWNVYHKDGGSILRAHFGASQPYVHVGGDRVANLYVNGFTGIGTSSPNSLLDVKYKDASTNLYRATDQNGQYRWRIDQAFGMLLSNSSGTDIVNIGQGGTWFNSGNVGIGTASPGFLLDVNGIIGISGVKVINTNNNANDIYINSRVIRNESTANQDGMYINYNSGGGSNAHLRFYANGTSERMRIDASNGNVGIGTTSPNQKLTVNGTIYGREVKVDLSVPGPDYVFDEEYALSSLESVKNYIDQNKHLPEVPSAKEMETNGINLSEMNMLLLKKVEELTLHVINQNEKNLELSKQIQALRDEIKQIKANK